MRNGFANSIYFEGWFGLIACNTSCSYFPVLSSHVAFQPVREAVSYRGLFTAGWFDVREKHCSRLEIYDRLRASEQAAYCNWSRQLCTFTREVDTKTADGFISTHFYWLYIWSNETLIYVYQDRRPKAWEIRAEGTPSWIWWTGVLTKRTFLYRQWYN